MGGKKFNRKPETGPRSRTFPKRGRSRGGPEMTSLHNSVGDVIPGAKRAGPDCAGVVKIV